MANPGGVEPLATGLKVPRLSAGALHSGSTLLRIAAAWRRPGLRSSIVMTGTPSCVGACPFRKTGIHFSGTCANWYTREGSNLRPVGYRPTALPLSYECVCVGASSRDRTAGLLHVAQTLCQLS